jgi:predicted N-acyltransferase
MFRSNKKIQPSPPLSLTPKVFSSIHDVPAAHWDGLLTNRSCSFSREFWATIEQAALNDFSYRHVIFYYKNGEPAALASYYVITTDIAIFAPPLLRNMLTAIRKLLPNFLKMRMLECGTPITVASPPFAAADDIRQAVVTALENVLRQAARAEKPFIILLRDFEPNAADVLPALKKFGYHLVDSLPNTYLDITWATPQDYVRSMKSYYRSKLQRHLKINAAQGVTHELRDDFYDLADTLCAQWLTVHHQADEFQREVLTPEFYRAFSRNMGSRSKVLLFYRNGELAGHSLLLLDGEVLRWLYIGRAQATNDSLYIYIAHKVIKTAIVLGAKRLELGLTTYSIKQDLGAQMVPVKIALRSALAIINPFVGWGYALLNSTPEIRKKNIFKQP